MDAVTVHDYTLSTKAIAADNASYLGDWAQQQAYVASYGLALVPQYLRFVRDTFGGDVAVWMTEFDVAIGDAAFGANATFMDSNLHALYSLAYIVGAVCDDKLEMLLHTMWSEQDGTDWFARQATNYNSAQPNDAAGARFDIVAQTRAQLAWIATVRNDQQMCVHFEAADACPAMTVQVKGAEGMPCVHGVAFRNSSDAHSLGLLLLNACDLSVNVSVSVGVVLEGVLDVWEYGAGGSGSDTSRFVDCTATGHVWDQECAAVKPTYSQIDVHGEQDIHIALPPISFVLAATQ